MSCSILFIIFHRCFVAAQVFDPVDADTFDEYFGPAKDAAFAVIRGTGLSFIAIVSFVYYFDVDDPVMRASRTRKEYSALLNFQNSVGCFCAGQVIIDLCPCSKMT